MLRGTILKSFIFWLSSNCGAVVTVYLTCDTFCGPTAMCLCFLACSVLGTWVLNVIRSVVFLVQVNKFALAAEGHLCHTDAEWTKEQVCHDD